MDIVGIVRPLVDTAFNIAGNIKVDVTFTLGDKKNYDARADTDLADTGGTTFTCKAFQVVKAVDAQSDITKMDEHLIVNESDLETAAKQAGVPSLEITASHKAVVEGETWNIISVAYNVRVFDVRIRR
jgi:hypothetical protein